MKVRCHYLSLLNGHAASHAKCAEAPALHSTLLHKSWVLLRSKSVRLAQALDQSGRNLLISCDVLFNYTPKVDFTDT